MQRTAISSEDTTLDKVQINVQINGGGGKKHNYLEEQKHSDLYFGIKIVIIA